MENKKTYRLIALGMMVLLGLSFAFAYQGDYTVQGPNYSDERHEAMETAFDNLDYDAWVALMTESGRTPGVLRKVTENNFATFVATHEAAEEGDLDKAAELRAELGLGQGSKGGKISGRGSHMRGNSLGGCPYAN